MDNEFDMDVQAEDMEVDISSSKYYVFKTIATSLIMYMFLQGAFILLTTPILVAILDVYTLDAKVTVALNIFLVIVPTLMIMKRYLRKLNLVLPLQRNFAWDTKKVLFFTILAIGISIGAGILINVVNLLFQQLGITLTTPSFGFTSDIGYNILNIISIVIVAPIFEELLYRGLILTALRKYGNLFAMVTTSLLFALAHGNFIQAFPIFFFSLILCYVVLRSNSLYVAIAIHLINNALSLLGLTFSGNEVLMVVFALLEIGILLFACIMLWKKRAAIKAYIQDNKGEKITSFFKNWVIIIYLIMILLAFVDSIKY